MKVYVKSQNKKSIFIRLFVAIMFLGYAIWFFISLINKESFIVNNPESSKYLFLFAVIFLLVGIVLVYELIKKTKSYKVKLIKKKVEMYKNKLITHMYFEMILDEYEEKDFEIDYEGNPDLCEYKCYTFGENHFVEGKEYFLRIKEFNDEPKYIDEFMAYENTLSTNDKEVSGILLFFICFFGGMILLSLLGLIFYPQHALSCIFAAAFCGAGLYLVLKGKKQI